MAHGRGPASVRPAGAGPRATVFPMMRLSPDDKREIAARAATLDERVAAAALLPPAIPVTRPDPLLTHWNQAFAPGDAAAFARRLGWDGLDVASASRAARLSVADGWTPDEAWTDWLDRFVGRSEAVLADFLAAPARAEPRRDCPFDDIWEVMRREASQAVRDATVPHTRARLSAAASTALERQLLAEIGRYGDAAMFSRVRASIGDAASAASSERYRAFVSGMLAHELPGFFREYAVLARQIVIVVASWVARTTEFIVRLDADREAIAQAFADGRDIGDVVGVAPGLSDPHHGRARVAAVTFASGLTLVYKPRSVAVEREFGRLLAWIAPSLEHAPRGLRTLDRATHGWVECARQAPFSSRADVAAYYYRAGALMCVTSVLGARDLHRDNVVATVDGPALVDLEMLLQPAPRTTAASPGRAPDDQPASCLATGLLSLVDLTPDGTPHDAGGLRGERTGALPFPRRVWLDVGTDAVRSVDEPAFEVSGAHEVVLDGAPQRPDAWAGDLLRGFGDAYRHLLARRSALARADGPLRGFEGCAIRLLPRRTNQYAMLAHLLATPKYQTDGAAASCAIDVLHRGFGADVTRPPLWDVAVEERRAMAALDIPYFSIACEGTDAMADGRVVAAGHYAASALEAARGRVRTLSDADLRDQLAVLARALGESVASTFSRPLAAPADSPGAMREAFVASAEWIGAELLARAVRSGSGSLTWEYRRAPEGPSWRAHHLYDGTMGPVLLYAALAVVTGAPQWTRAAADALASVRNHARQFPIAQLPVDEPIGGCSGLASIVYGLAVASVLGVNDDDLRTMGADLAGAIAPRARAAAPLDVVNGVAGAVLGLLAWHSVTGDARALASACACGDRLLAREERHGGLSSWPADDGTVLVGFAHGVAGIALALARLASVTDDVRYARAARAAFRFVRRHHLEQSGNWPIAIADGHAAGGVMTGWCHGAPGVAQAALGSCGLWLRAADTTRRGVEVALRSVPVWQPAQADHVCCGALARAEALLAAGRSFGRDDLVRAGRAIAERVVDRARKRGHFRLCGPGTDYRVFDPGFFQGLSGIGYQLLRMAHPERLPSITAFVGASGASLRYCSPWPNAAGNSGHTSPRSDGAFGDSIS